MYLADYHTHSRCSPDGRDSMTELARAAMAVGLEELCFTDHLETVDWASGRLRTDFDWSGFVRDFCEAQVACGDVIQLRLGAELGDAPRDFALAERLMEKSPKLDFVIGSVHTLSSRYGHADLYSAEEQSEADCRMVIADYLEQVLALAKWGKFHVLGHLTLPLRYMNENRSWHMSFDGFESQVADIFRTLLQNGCGIELNANRGNAPLPGEKWLRLYRELGGERITLGSDAHRSHDLGRGIREGQELLRCCGFTRFCSFTAGKPVFHSL